MSDFALEWDNAAGAASVVVESGDLKPDDGLRTAIMISLFTDAPALPGDVLPDSATHRRGFWGDAVPEVQGDVTGSRLWLLDRSKRTPDVLDRANVYGREALQWLLDERVCERFDFVTEFYGEGLAYVVTVYRPGVDPARFRFDHTWTAEDARR